MKLTEEHVIPQSIGGKLVSPFLCHGCNTNMGTRIDSQIKNDPAIKCAVQNLEGELPDFARGFYDGQEFEVTGEGPDTMATYKGGRVRTDAKMMPDGSLIVDTQDAPKHLERMMSKEGVEHSKIETVLEYFANAPDNEDVRLVPGFNAVKWSIKSIRPSLAGKSADFSFPVKIAYEFLALHLGSSIFNDGLDAVRGALREGVLDKTFHVEKCFVEPYSGWHGIAIVRGTPCTVRFRLFGALHYQVLFPNFGLMGPRFQYDHNMKTGEESCSLLD